jgi:hypothetical protein
LVAGAAPRFASKLQVERGALLWVRRRSLARLRGGP